MTTHRTLSDRNFTKQVQSSVRIQHPIQMTDDISRRQHLLVLRPTDPSLTVVYGSRQRRLRKTRLATQPTQRLTECLRHHRRHMSTINAPLLHTFRVARETRIAQPLPMPNSTAYVTHVVTPGEGQRTYGNVVTAPKDTQPIPTWYPARPHHQAPPRTASHGETVSHDHHTAPAADEPGRQDTISVEALTHPPPTAARSRTEPTGGNER